MYRSPVPPEITQPNVKRLLSCSLYKQGEICTFFLNATLAVSAKGIDWEVITQEN